MFNDKPSFLIGDFDTSAEPVADKSLLSLYVIAVTCRTGVMKLCEVVLFVIGDMYYFLAYFFSSKNPRTGFRSFRTRGFLNEALLSTV